MNLSICASIYYFLLILFLYVSISSSFLLFDYLSLFGNDGCYAGVVWMWLMNTDLHGGKSYHGTYQPRVRKHGLMNAAQGGDHLSLFSEAAADVPTSLLKVDIPVAEEVAVGRCRQVLREAGHCQSNAGATVNSDWSAFHLLRSLRPL